MESLTRAPSGTSLPFRDGTPESKDPAHAQLKTRTEISCIWERIASCNAVNEVDTEGECALSHKANTRSSASGSHFAKFPNRRRLGRYRHSHRQRPCAGLDDESPPNILVQRGNGGTVLDVPAISETIRSKMSSSSRETRPRRGLRLQKRRKCPKSMTKIELPLSARSGDSAMTTERKAVDLPESGPPRIDTAPEKSYSRNSRRCSSWEGRRYHGDMQRSLRTPFVRDDPTRDPRPESGTDESWCREHPRRQPHLVGGHSLALHACHRDVDFHHTTQLIARVHEGHPRDIILRVSSEPLPTRRQEANTRETGLRAGQYATRRRREHDQEAREQLVGTHGWRARTRVGRKIVGIRHAQDFSRFRGGRSSNRCGRTGANQALGRRTQALRGGRMWIDSD